MRQQINLYQDVLIDRPVPLRARQFISIVLISLICLSAVVFFNYRQLRQVIEQRDTLRHQVESENQRVTALELQYPEVNKDVLLEEKIQRLKQEITGKRQALDYFSAQDVEKNAKILAILDGLARTPYEGVWLTQIRLFEQGEEILLTGSALSADRVPAYLTLLGAEHIFGGRIFDRLKLSRLKDRAGLVDFHLTSSREKGH
jgi:Tfp pilus assembly protein PilN